MAPRTATRQARENDFSDVGKVGRRTGVTLPQGRIDVNGMEEITGIFSSPRKPSPLRKSTLVVETIEERNADATPSHALSSRKTALPPRSASPRKSGISGTARRSRTIDLLGQNREKAVAADISDEVETETPATPHLTTAGASRFSPEKTPLRPSTRSRPQASRTVRQDPEFVENDVNELAVLHVSTPTYEQTEILPEYGAEDVTENDYVAPVVDDDEVQVSRPPTPQEERVEPPLPQPYDDEEEDQTFQPETRSKSKPKEPNAANSRRKRKSDAVEQEVEVDAISSPAAKRAKRISDQSSKNQRTVRSSQQPEKEAPAPKSKARQPLKTKDANLKMSSKQQKELNNIIEKVKARPGQKKSLYVLRRETPAEEGVTHTRSGRVSVKPLAYWRNERCVYGGSPGGASLDDGARFPLNSIREIIRTEEVSVKSKNKSKKSKNRKGKDMSRDQSGEAKQARDGSEADGDGDRAEEDEEEADVDEDLDAEPWEIEKGIFKGPVTMWDSLHQAPTDEEEEIDIAYAPASIETRDVKGSTFRYAKLLSMKFFGSGIVDLPPGGVKKSKNSRRMYMSFFVATGRVTVQTGPIGKESQFSIGEGGWWQVPRGNQYSIANELQKPARIFFSQACEPEVLDDSD